MSDVGLRIEGLDLSVGERVLLAGFSLAIGAGRGDHGDGAERLRQVEPA